MLLAIIFFNVWGVLQLVALGSFARTVRVRTILAGIAVGLCFCAPFAALLEYTSASVIAALMGRPVEAVLAVTVYTVDPVIEEIIRILPLTLLLMVPFIRRQLSVTDCVLIGAAAGAGFALAEDLYRFGAAPQYATAIPGGWIAPFDSPVAAGGGRLFIPSVTTTIGSWLPDMGGAGLFGLSSNIGRNTLLIWSALAGLGVGLWLRLDGRRRWYVAAALLVYASGAHAAGNADIIARRDLLLTAPFRAVYFLTPLLPIAALALAWWVDRRRQGMILPEHLLAAEQSASPRALGTLQASLVRMPESIVWVDRFVRLRRVYNNERFLGGPEAERLRLPIEEVRNLLDHQLQGPGSWRAAALAWKENAVRGLCQSTTMLWMILILPSALWFVVGGWPATSGVQRLLSGGAGWGLAIGLTIAAQGWLAWRMLSSLRWSRRLLHIPIGDRGTAIMLGFVGGTGALGFGTLGLLRAAAASTANLAHAIDAFASLAAPLLPPLVNLGPALWDQLFKPSPRDFHVPLGDGQYFTPTGVRRTVANNLVDKVARTADIDPSGNSGYVRRAMARAGVPVGLKVPKMNVGGSDPNDLSEFVGDEVFMAAEHIFGHAMVEEALPVGGGVAPRRGPTANPALADTVATPPRTGGNPALADTVAAPPGTGGNPALADTVAVSPTSPLATTQSPMASTVVPKTPKIDDP